MKKEIIDLDNWFQKSSFIVGYGKFPYLIIKTDYKAFMQIPIHFNANDDYINYPGIHINNISDDVISKYESNKTSELHETLINVCKTTKKSIEENRKKPCVMCLVEGQKIGYYFEGDKITFNSNIPSGGTLVTSENIILALNSSHYV
jgi:hypothetical protein